MSKTSSQKAKDLNEKPAPDRSRGNRRGGLLVDRPFQFKYTAYIVGLTIAICVPLGVLLAYKMNEAVQLGDDAVTMAASANDSAKVGLEQAIVLNRRLEMESLLKFGDKPDALEAVKRANKIESDRLTARATELQKEEERIRQKRNALASQRRTILLTVSAAMILLVIFVALTAISFTHRVAGPIHRMRMLFAEVGEGVFSPYRPLRERDELQDAFAEFSAMVEKVKARQKADLEKLDEAIARVASAGVDEGSIADLRTVRNSISSQIEGQPSVTKIEK